MTWIIDKDDEVEFMGRTADYPDRVVGLLAPTILDRRLEAAIRARWQDTQDGNLLRDLFRDGGQLGSFMTRIQIGFAIRLYEEETFRDLRTIGKIRNDFAHTLEAQDFKYQSIRDRVEKLILPDKYPVKVWSEIMLSEPSATAQLSTESLDDMLAVSAIGPPIDARKRFLRAIEIATIGLWYHTVTGGPTTYRV